MKIDLLCSSENHPINPWLKEWAKRHETQHIVRLLHNKNHLQSGDILFLISCTEVISKQLRNSYRSSIVLHASNLPNGRGWSPHIWQILNGARTITVSAINAEDKIDSGDIWAKKTFNVAPDELHDEINLSLFQTELSLLDQVVEMVEKGHQPHPQPDEEATYFPRRTPDDSRIDPYRSIADQFNKIRISDPSRFPAFFELHGSIYTLNVKKVERDE